MNATNIEQLEYWFTGSNVFLLTPLKGNGVEYKCLFVVKTVLPPTNSTAPYFQLNTKLALYVMHVDY